MASSAYKGLTIRLGMDTSGFAAGIRAANSAAHKAQTELNKLERASKLDPGNMSTFTRHIGVLGEQAVNVATKMGILSQGIKELGSAPVAGLALNVADLARNTESATMAAERAKVAYTNAGAALQRMYKGIAEKTGDKAFRNFDGTTSMDNIRKTLEAAQKAGKLSSAEVENYVGEIAKLKKEWVAAEQAYDDYTSVAELQRLTDELAAQEAAINGINRELAQTDRYNSFKDLGAQLAPINERLTLVEAAAKAAGEQFKRFDDAYNFDTSNVDMAEGRIRALGEAMQTAQMRADLLRQRISAYEAAGIDGMARDITNISVEVRESEAAWHRAKRALEEYRATGDETSNQFRRLESVVDAAQRRMDTAHAVQQYNTLRIDLAEVNAEFVDLAKILADIHMPSSVAEGLGKMKSDYDEIANSLREITGITSGLESALQLNPQNITIATTQVELLEEAERLATEQAENLRQQLASYDVDAIRAASDYSKSATQQALEASEAYKSATSEVARLNTEIINLKNDMSSKGAPTFYEMLDLSKLQQQLKDAEVAERKAFEALDTSRGRVEIEKLTAKTAEAAATQDKLFVSMMKLSGANFTPNIDTSAVKELGDSFKELEKSSTVAQGVADVSVRAKALADDIKVASDRAKDLDEALKKNPGDEGLKAERMEAFATATALARERVSLLTSEYSKFDPSKIDEVALATGNAGEKAAAAAQKYTVAFDAMKEKADEIAAKQKEISEISIADMKTDEGISKYERLQSELGELNAEYQDLSKSAKEALAEYDSAKATQETAELREEIREAVSVTTELESKARDLSEVKVKSEFAKDWTDALKVADDRLDRLNKAAEIRPNNIGLLAERSRALAEAYGAATDKVKDLQAKIRSMKADGVDKLAKSMNNVAIDTAKADKAAADAKKRVDELQVAYDQAKESAARLEAEAGRGVEGASEKYKEAERAVDDFAKQLEEAKRAQREADSAADTAHTVSEWREATTQLEEYKSRAKEIASSAKASFGEITNAAVTAADAVGDLMRRIGSEVIDSSNDIDTAYRNLRKTFDAEEEDYQKLYDAAMKYSQSHVTSADTMLDMEAVAAQLGVGIEGGAEAIQDFADAAANLDVATDIDSETIALQMGQIMNVMSDVDTNNIDKFADALVRLGNNMPTQESNIMQVTQRLAAIGDVAHFTTPQLMGWAAAIASTGQKSEAAASGIATTITNISKAVSAGDGGLSQYAAKAGVTVTELSKAVETGSSKLSDYASAAGVAKKDLSDAVEQTKSLAQYAELAGYSTEEFVDAWRNAPSDTLKRFVEGLRDSGDELFATLMDLDINGVRQNQTLAALAQTIDTVDDSVRMADDAFQGLGDEFGEAGDAEREATRKAEGFSGSLAKMQNSAQVLAATFGDSLVPYMDGAASIMQKLTEYIDDMDDSTKDAIVRWGGLTAAISTAYPIARALLTPMAKLVGGLKDMALTMAAGVSGKMLLPMILQDAILNAEVALEGFAAVLAGVGGAIAAFAVPLVGIAALLGISYVQKANAAREHTESLNSALSGMKENASDISMALWNGKDSVVEFGDASETAASQVSDLLDTISEHNRRNAETRESAEETIGMLSKYKEIIDECAGAGSVSAEKMAELSWALDGIADATGKQYDASDILLGTWTDEEGAAHDLRTEIDKLIETKKREAKVDALKSMYTDAYKVELEAEQAYEKAGDELREYVNHWKNTMLETGQAKDVNDALRQIYASPEYETMRQHLTDAAVLYKGAREEREKYAEAMGNEIAAEYDVAAASDHVRENMMRSNEVMSEALDKAWEGEDKYRELAKAIETNQLAFESQGEACDNFADELGKVPEAFASMVAQSGGEIQKLADMITAYERITPEVKELIVSYDETGFSTAEGDRIVWNDGEWQWQETGVSVDMTEVEKVPEKVEEVAEQASESAEVEVPVEADTEPAREDVDEFAQEASEDTTITAKVETDTEGADEEGVQYILELDGQTIDVALNITANTEATQEVIDALAQVENKDVTITVKESGVQSASKHVASLNKAASAMESQRKSYTATGNATKTSAHKNIESLNKAAASMKGASATYTARGNAASGEAARNIWDLIRATNNMYSKSVTLTTKQVTVKSTVDKGGSAAGTYIDPNRMPRHAAGIFTRPTLTNIGWVGEDGAELYSGNSLVPLTNRKYSMPYINDISDAVARKMGGAGKTTTINMTVNCEGDPNDTASAIVRALELYDL